MKVLGEIYEYSTAEFLARADNFSHDSISPYIEEARLVISGLTDGLSSKLVDSIKIHGLMLEDKEEEVLSNRPDLEPAYAAADSYQLDMTTSRYNLDHFLKNGIDYEFNTGELEQARHLAAKNNGFTIQALMREKILKLSGFDGVSANFIFHDVLDHAWLFNMMRNHGLNHSYGDFIQAVGDPFTGHLMSRESELLSGIGFTSRRFLSDENYYGTLALNAQDLADFIHSRSKTKDVRVDAAVDLLEDDFISVWAGFVVKATISNLLVQREWWGTVKDVSKPLDSSTKRRGDIVSITDPRYLALIIETTHLLAMHKEQYMGQELALNDVVESALNRFINTGKGAGSIAVIQSLSPDDKYVVGNFGLSTNHFSNREK
jgi:hypothetical protein